MPDMPILPINIVNNILEMHREIRDEEQIKALIEEHAIHRWLQDRKDFLESYSDDDDWSTHRYFD